jgi:hypothetical protein
MQIKSQSNKECNKSTYLRNTLGNENTSKQASRVVTVIPLLMRFVVLIRLKER